MIVTVTPNPALDRTLELAAPLERGAVQRANSSSCVPAGKGVNVSLAALASGMPTLAIVPSAEDDPLALGLRAAGVPLRAVPIAGSCRTNTTIAEADGTTTKVNEPGPVLSVQEGEALQHAAREAAQDARWVVLAGSLPRGLDPRFYADLVRSLPSPSPLVAVDTSLEPARATIGAVRVDLVKPNAEELLDLLGETGDAGGLERDPDLAARSAHRLLARGVGAVLCTLGAHGAVLVTGEGAWFGSAPTVQARSTVGAGDSALAGYLTAESSGADPAERLRRAIASGTAAAALPGSTMPTPEQVQALLPQISVSSLSLEENRTPSIAAQSGKGAHVRSDHS